MSSKLSSGFSMSRESSQQKLTYSCFFCALKGMEDAHAHILSLGEEQSEGKKTSFFAVYDGHGGKYPIGA